MTLSVLNKEHEHFWLHSQSILDGQKASKVIQLRGRHTCSATKKPIRLLFKQHLECTEKAGNTKQIPFILAKVKCHLKTTIMTGFCVQNNRSFYSKVTYYVHENSVGKQHHFRKMQDTPYFTPENLAKKIEQIIEQINQSIEARDFAAIKTNVLGMAAICLLPGIQKSDQLVEAMRLTGHFIGCGLEKIERSPILGRELLKKTLAYEPENVQIISNLAHIQVSDGKYDEAKQLGIKVCLMRPDYPYAIQILGDAFSLSKTGVEAVEFFESLLKQRPYAHIKAALAEQYTAGGKDLPCNFKKAEELFLQALQTNPEDHYSRISLAIIYDTGSADVPRDSKKAEEQLLMVPYGSDDYQHAQDVLAKISATKAMGELIL